MPETMTKIKPSCLEIKVFGKVDAVERIQGKKKQFYANTVVIPAENTFKKPVRIVINSQEPIAAEGELIETIAYVTPQWRNKDNNWYFNCNLWKEKWEH